MNRSEFYDQVAKRAHALEHSVRIDQNRTESSMTLNAPSAVSNFIGKTLTLIQTIIWTAPHADGRYENRVSGTLVGLPATLTADGMVTPTADGAVLSYKGDITVQIPLLGRRLEQEAEPFIRSAFDAQAKVVTSLLAPS